ncbi:MAG: alpha-L-fucosidase [Phycisphaerales bacterium]
MDTPGVIAGALAALSCPCTLLLAGPPDDAATRDLMHRAAAVVASERQIDWQRLELQCFVHFGVNTFTGREWGEGTESPGNFNPTDFDAEQWVLAAKEAGMRAMILTAKHHDGFCLWPSAFTEHSVKNSPWRGGQGDVVKEVSEACRKHGLKFGVYLSPADIHEPSYGDSPRYNEYFMNQLRELLTNYGQIHEVWFDGATPKDKGQVYDYQKWYALIRELQPQAVIFGRGPDVRWVGNEGGQGRASEWSVVPLPAPPEECTWPDMTAADLGSLVRLRDAKYLHWYPAETDTSLRPGWFWRESENARVRPLSDLLNVYYNSVGNNCVLLLNVPPDTRGRFHENDVARLKELGRVLRGTFSSNLARAADVRAASDSQASGHAAGFILDGDPETFWTSADWEFEPGVVITLPQPREVSVVMLQEHMRSGQRVEKFVVEAWDANRWATAGSGWVEVASGTTIGYKRLARFPRLTTDRVRLRFPESRVRPTLAEFGLFDEPVLLGPPRITRGRDGVVTIAAGEREAGSILYTLDGSAPTEGAAGTVVYSRPFALPAGGEVRARAMPRAGASAGEVIAGDTASASFDVCKATWKIVSASSEQPSAGEGKENTIDDRADTIWHTQYSPETRQHPHEIVIDLGAALTLRGFTYLPRQNGPINGTIVKYEFYTSDDGKQWGGAGGAGGGPVSAGEFPNIRNNPVEQRIMFGSPRTARFIKFVALSEVNGNPWASAAEIGVITR